MSGTLGKDWIKKAIIAANNGPKSGLIKRKYRWTGPSYYVAAILRALLER
jgi:hypothetical protein